MKKPIGYIIAIVLLVLANIALIIGIASISAETRKLNKILEVACKTQTRPSSCRAGLNILRDMSDDDIDDLVDSMGL